MNEIEVSRRSGYDKPRYLAQIKDKPQYWDCGDSRNEAIGNLIRTHPEQFNIKIIDKPD